MLVHHGDQVYADKAFNAGKRLLSGKKDTRPVSEKYKQIVVEYQKFYRVTWSQPETRLVLASVSVRAPRWSNPASPCLVCTVFTFSRVLPFAFAQNLMLWDDHEVRNDWGRYDKVPATHLCLLMAILGHRVM